MSEASDKRSEEFLKISGQFKLGALVTESSHPVTADLSEVAKRDIAAALDLLFQVDGDVVKKYREFAESGRAASIKDVVLRSLRNGGKLFFTGCGSTGRLSIQLVSIWRDFWQQQRARGLASSPSTDELEDRAFSVMAGGDYALIKSVEGFEDFAAFGRKQLSDLGVSDKDVVFAITEGGETSFVIGTAWQGVDAGAKVYFVYNNPDDVLCEHVERSREVIQDSRIEKINLTTGPMAITGSTRMQATTIQLCVLLTVLEMVLCKLMDDAAAAESVSARFLAGLTTMHATLKSSLVRSQLAKLVALEETVYRAGRKNNYYADRFGIDVLTDTTERSPTYCTPPFRKFDDSTATESWSFLFLPVAKTPKAWEQILKRPPRCVEWIENEVRELVGPEKLARTLDVVRRISRLELMRFKIGRDGAAFRSLANGESAIGILGDGEESSLFSPDGILHAQLADAHKRGAQTGLIYFVTAGCRRWIFEKARDLDEIDTESWLNREYEKGQQVVKSSVATVIVTAPKTDFLLDGVTRVGMKMLLNALSTCTMVRLGRVMGNFMIWVVPSNLKLIDRATRYVQKLTGLTYEEANRRLFESIEYVEPRMKSDQAYPPVVGLTVLRIREQLTNEEAEKTFNIQHSTPNIQ